MTILIFVTTAAPVIDDIDNNSTFVEFRRSVDCESLVCAAEPICPDKRRLNEQGFLGVALKPEQNWGSMAPPRHYQRCGMRGRE